MALDKLSEKIKKVMNDPKNIRNIGVAAHIDHGNY
jgi:translation elongation factor EF-G